MPEAVTVYSDADVPSMLDRMQAALAAQCSPADETEPDGTAEIQPAESLIGIDPSVYTRINTAIRSGKRHLLFYGPPGTGKTELAQLVAGQLSEDWRLLTGSADWSSQDVIGGYMPAPGGRLKFCPGLLLQNFNAPLILDELNRCDIDKVLGPLFTVLSGQGTTLPYFFHPDNDESDRVSIHPPGGVPSSGPKFLPGSGWRLIATINTLDRSSLYQMSYALMRRFAWIHVGVPADLRGFVSEFLLRNYQITTTTTSPLSDIWAQINVVRPLGPAPFIDVIKYLRAIHDSFDFEAEVDGNADRQEAYLSALDVFVFPLLDGIRPEQAHALGTALASIMGLSNENESNALRKRLLELVA